MAGDARVPVYLGHALGGGAEHDLMRRVAADIAAQGAAVVLRVGGPLRWQVELHSAQGVTRGTLGDGPDDRAALIRLIGLLPRRQVIYSCGVGDADPAGLPDILLALALGQGRGQGQGQGQGPGDGNQHGITILIHDFFPLGPAYALLDADDVWRGLPMPGDGRRGHDATRPDGSVVDLAAWRAAWGQLIAAADEITVFAGSGRDLVAAVWPQARPRIVVRPHPLPPPLPPLPDGRVARPDGPPVIGVLGNIGAHKGAGVVIALARALARNPVAGLVLIGDLDPAFRLPRPGRIHGRYTPDQIPALARRYRISHWLIPSIWPETFSFTTHEALATGLPVIAFDLGAQAEAVSAAIATGAPGAVIALPASPAAAAAAVLAAVLAVASGPETPV